MNLDIFVLVLSACLVAIAGFLLLLIRYDVTPRGFCYKFVNRTVLSRTRSKPRLLNLFRKTSPSVLPHHTPISLEMETYDGSGQLTHPDVLFIPEGFVARRTKYWMVATPYPYSSDAFENPSIYTSDDGIRWVVPAGLVNPVIDPPKKGHLSDPCLVYEGNRLLLYYRATETLGSRVRNSIWLSKSSEGVVWSKPVQVIVSDTDGLLSPSVEYDGSLFLMWTVDDNQWPYVMRRRESPDGVSWKETGLISVVGLGPNRSPWHIDLSKGKGLLTSCEGLGGRKARLHFCEIVNKSLVRVGPFLTPILHEFEASLQYRGSIVKVNGIPDLYEIWYSAMSKDSVWVIAYTSAVEMAGDLHALGSFKWKTGLS